jgi:hypothetical protein
MFQNVTIAQVRECLYKIRNVIGLSFHSSSSSSSGGGGVRNILSLPLWVTYKKYGRAREAKRNS